MSTKVLSVVETAYRATLEEQDDTILWLNHMLHDNGLDVSVLLRANAVNYAVEGQDASGLQIGDRPLRHPPRLDEDLAALLGKGVPVYVVAEDVAVRGIPVDGLVTGAKPVAEGELGTLYAQHDAVWQW
jgi:intracellular sulfur oxidation DsrE/DsrF family protein